MTAERVVLNFMQRMSGIATLTKVTGQSRFAYEIRVLIGTVILMIEKHLFFSITFLGFCWSYRIISAGGTDLGIFSTC